MVDAARTGDRQTLPVYVINLDSRPERMRLQNLQSRLHGFILTRFPAMNGQAGVARFPDAQLSNGAKGMWHSFDTLVRELASQGVPAAIILEDDAILLPGFMRLANRIRNTVDPEVALVQLGFLSESSWRPQNSPLQNIKKLLRPRSRLRAFLKHEPRTPRFGMKAGMHATLVFPDRLAKVLDDLLPFQPESLPIDNTLVAHSRKHPRLLTRAAHSWAFQLPVSSDIPWIARTPQSPGNDSDATPPSPLGSQDHEQSREQPMVTAIVPTYNSARFLEETLNALLCQTQPIHILIGDDASSDGTQVLLPIFQRRSDKISVILREANLGWMRNANDLLNRVDTELAFFAFHDDLPEPTYVATLTEALVQNPRAVLAYSDMRLIQADQSQSTEVFSALDGRRSRVDRGWTMLGGPPRWWVPVHGVFRTSEARRTGGFRRHEAGDFSADWPFLFHLSLLGEFVHVPRVLLQKVYQPGSVSRSWERSPETKAALKSSLRRVIDESPLTPPEKALLKRRLENHIPAPRWARQIGKTVFHILRLRPIIKMSNDGE